MVSHGTVASFLVLSEDMSNHAAATLELLLCELLRHFDSQFRADRVRFDPGSEEERKLLSANQFADPKRYNERTRLHRVISERLVVDTGFVLQHVDADRTWRDRKRDPSTNAAHLERHIVEPVLQLIESRYRGSIPKRRRRSEPTEGLTESEIRVKVDAHMKKYFRVVPYREIEAWLYQNTQKAAALCQENPACRGKHLDKLASWRADRGLLDELPRPASELCIGKRHNSELARGYPTREVYAAGKSLAAAVDAMLACDDLLHALQRTHETNPGDPGST